MPCLFQFEFVQEEKNMKNQIFEQHIDIQHGPFVVTAIHDGHAVRENLQGRYNLSDQERFREEDPFTGEMARKFGNYIIGTRSRFEVDLNRGPKSAVYRKPEDAWGLKVWKEPITDAEVEESIRLYNHFYENVETQLSRIIDVYGFVLVYDLHSYNHRREGPEKPAARQEDNPDIDVLTTGIHLDKWRPVLDRFKQALQDYPYPDGPLDVREEVRFEGRLSHFMQWILNRFQEKAFVPSIEFKKIFMDEWTGELYQDKLNHLSKALLQTVDPVMEEIRINEKIPATL